MLEAAVIQRGSTLSRQLTNHELQDRLQMELAAATTSRRRKKENPHATGTYRWRQLQRGATSAVPTRRGVRPGEVDNSVEGMDFLERTCEGLRFVARAGHGSDGRFANTSGIMTLWSGPLFGAVSADAAQPRVRASGGVEKPHGQFGCRRGSADKLRDLLVRRRGVDF